MNARNLLLALLLLAPGAALAQFETPVYELWWMDVTDVVPTGVVAWGHKNGQHTMVYVEPRSTAQNADFQEQCVKSVPWKNPNEHPEYCYRVQVWTQPPGAKDPQKILFESGPVYYEWSKALVAKYGTKLPRANQDEFERVNKKIREYQPYAHKVRWNDEVQPAKLHAGRPASINVGKREMIDLKDLVAGPVECFTRLTIEAHVCDGPDNLTLVRIRPTTKGCDAACQAQLDKAGCEYHWSFSDRWLYRVVKTQ